MVGELRVDGRMYALTQAECLLPLDGCSRRMYLATGGANPNVGFGMWDVEFALLTDLNDLDGKRMHVRPDYSTYKDDSLGTDITGMYETTDINYLSTDERTYYFGEIQLDFERVEGMRYRCRFEATLTTDGTEELRKLPLSAFTHRARAEFTVMIEEERIEG